MNYSLSLETHYYDGKLTEDKKSIQIYLDLAARITRDQKLVAFLHLRTLLSRRPSFGIQAQSFFNSIITDFQRSGRAPGPNYDPTNDLYADDLLYICWLACQKCEDAIDIVNEQLNEMNQGFCAQGRTCRLIGIMGALIELINTR